ncbi:MAG TPA: DUF4919 domain-containing protein [Bacteroidia bacterium]|jgi:hypothetical protein|nr:DUF4919 domain-containing protein [Bacteroidia bacterium]
MKTKFFLLLAVVQHTFTGLAQQAPQVIPPPFQDNYSATVKKLESGQTDINYREFRESFLESEQFKVASRKFSRLDSLQKEMYAQMHKSNYPELIKITKQMLSIDYTSMLAHKILRQTYKLMGDTINSKKYHDIQFGLLKSIIKNGDGKTCATAWPVIQISEEYFILDMLGAELKKQSIDNHGGLCDRMDVKEDKEKKTYYFETSKVFAGYDKLKSK